LLSVSVSLAPEEARAITRRRQHLVYNRKHHEKLARPQTQTGTKGKDLVVHGLPGMITAPVTVIQGDKQAPIAATHAGKTVGMVSTRFASTQATNFEPPRHDSNGEPEMDWEAGTQSSYASTLGGKDVIFIPPRPKDADGIEMTQFECPYCFRIQEIHSSRAWR
jgi:hypothetical protein